jgi:hypothetical protein
MFRSTASLIALFSAFAVGCFTNTQPVEQEPSDIASALEAENGGLSMDPENPAFGDDIIRHMSTFDTVYADAEDMTVQAAQATGARRYKIAVFWGHLPSARDAEEGDVEPQPIDWTGSISVDRGAIGVKRTLRFDSRDKVLPRTDAKTVSFSSHTQPHVDGLLLDVVAPAGGKVSFDTASLKTSIDLSQMAGVTRLGDGRNGMAYIGFADVPGCAQGFLFGHWHKVRPQLGVLRGRVVDGAGAPLGHIKGIWGHAPKKDKDLFFGKYISDDGQSKGLFGGTYGSGEFKGLWAVNKPAETGALQGFYSDGYVKDDGRGVYLGRWSERCGR